MVSAGFWLPAALSGGDTPGTLCIESLSLTFDMLFDTFDNANQADGTQSVTG